MRLSLDVCPDSIQVERSGDTEYNGYGFRSQPSITGRFSHSFTTPGTYYYIAEGYGHIGMTHEGHGYLYGDMGALVKHLVCITGDMGTFYVPNNSTVQPFLKATPKMKASWYSPIPKLLGWGLGMRLTYYCLGKTSHCTHTHVCMYVCMYV